MININSFLCYIENRSRYGFSLPELNIMCKFKNYEIYDYYEDIRSSVKIGNYRLSFIFSKNKKIYHIDLSMLKLIIQSYKRRVTFYV